MTQPSYPPPPPPKHTAERERGEFHLPRTNLFSRIRAQLAALERRPQFKSEMEPIMGFLIALISAALLGTLIALAVNRAILPAMGQAAWMLFVIITPVLEEVCKAMCMLIVAYAIPRMFLNRRYGAALGAATGLGFGIFESIIYVLGLTGVDALARLLVTPIMHPLWSAFVGIGVFVFVAKRPVSRSFFEAVIGLPLLFLLVGMINHVLWNCVAILLPAAGGIWATPHLTTVLDIIIVFPIFAFILRDFLGGHFNFQNFFEPLPELPPYYPKVAPPPPPPLTIPTCPTCGQPLVHIQEYNQWYCSKCRRYVQTS
ncbi:MAG: PrsW family glutamic-type intramembrane protease [Thermoproteota archaeon]|nr:PrsW family glutamic-type intramembrane protease [Thermoproteota archaeon]